MPEYLVTGSSGFIGSHLCRFLVGKGHLVTKTDISGDPDYLFDLRQADWEEINLSKFDGVIHLGAKISVPESITNPEEYSEVNVDATRGLFQACSDAGVPKVIFASSAAVYGSSNNDLMRVSDPTSPNSPYAENKKIGEDLALEFSSESSRFMSLRFFNVYGFGQSHTNAYASVIPIFISLISRGSAVTIYGDGSQTRDFIHVNDICRTVNSALLSDIPRYSVYNLGTGLGTSISELASILGRIFSKFGIQGKEPIFAPKRDGDIPFSIADLSGLESLIDISSFITLEEGLMGLVKRTLDESNA